MTTHHNIDFYKADHRSQYPENTEMVFSNLTPRTSRIDEIQSIVFFGLQYYIKKYLIQGWNRDFFGQPIGKVIQRYERRMKLAGINITYEHLEQLHAWRYLPLRIFALPEGTRCPIGVPLLVLHNTAPFAFWLTNYLETSISQTIWGPITSATIADQFRRILDKGKEESGGDYDVEWQGHDFSCRGMYGLEAAQMSGAGHLLSFCGTDTVPALDFLEQYYNADAELETVGGSCPATEHSVMSMGGQETEYQTFHRLITEVYPVGIVSIVSDTWDYWNVISKTLPSLKSEIMARKGTLVVRPDTGDPVKIIVGDPDAKIGSPERLGTYELLWRAFGGNVTTEGFKQLDPHIGVIYGDSITLERAKLIRDGLLKKKFVPDCVLGIGSFTYQHVTRDTFGLAMKATAGVIGGELREIFKDPKTGDGTKKSARGLLAVNKINGTLRLEQGCDWETVENCAFQEVFRDGDLIADQSLSEIRTRLR